MRKEIKNANQIFEDTVGIGEINHLRICLTKY